METIAPIEARMLALETRLENSEMATAQNTRRISELEESVTGVAESQMQLQRVIEGVAMRVARLTDVMTVNQLRIDRIVKNTDKTVALLEAPAVSVAREVSAVEVEFFDEDDEDTKP